MKEYYKASLTLLEDGEWHFNKVVVVENGLIVSVDDYVEGLKCVELKDEALMPGLINCHSHSFQRELRGLGETFHFGNQDSFWTWRQEMYRIVEELGKNKDAFFAAVKECFVEMVSSGITSVGEFHYFHHGTDSFDLDKLVLRAAHEAGIRLVLLNTFYCYSGFGDMPLLDAQHRFKTDDVQAFFKHLDELKGCLYENQSLGVVAHSLRAVNVAQLKQLKEGADHRALPFHLHIEEQPKEVEQCKQALDGRTPMRVLLDTVSVNHLTTAVHCNHTVVSELQEFIDKGGNVCIAPLTEGNLGDGVMERLEVAIANVCIGSDCNARIDMLEELRWLEYANRLKTLRRGVCAVTSATVKTSCTGSVLMHIATRNGARSLAVNAGTIRPGTLADFVTVNLRSPRLRGLDKMDKRLSAALIFGCAASEVIHGVCVGGKWVYKASN